MTEQRANELIEEILSAGQVESGIFITLLSKKYCEDYEMNKLTFISILSKTLTEEEEK